MGEPETLDFYDFGSFERVPKPQKQLSLSLETPGHLNKSRKNVEHFGNMFFINVKLLGLPNFDNVGEDGRRTIPNIRLIKF